MFAVEKLTIKTEQRNGRKAWTIVDNVNTLQLDKNDLKSLVKYLKKKLSCNGCLKAESDRVTMQFQGRHAEEISSILQKKKLETAERILIIGI
jgi:translation initiation factor 1 (eIF-1/SUI1)